MCHLPRILILAALSATGCGRATSILLVVEGDLEAETHADELEITVTSSEGVSWSSTYLFDADHPLPQSLRLVPGTRISGELDIEITAGLDGEQQVRAVRHSAFQSGQEVVERVCLQVSCIGSSDPACLDGYCDGGDDAGPDGDADIDVDVDADGDGDGDGDADGGWCDPSHCGGCCEGASCLTSGMDSCGVGGVPCATCDPALADRCSVDGRCMCGDHAPCPPGMGCSGGSCVCDASSCEGCCSDGRCLPISLARCARPGASCAACDSQIADTCSTTGACQCGDGPPCPDGQRCLLGGCVCDGGACPGCCVGESCRAGSSRSACGSGGFQCDTCGLASACPDGRCDGDCGSSCWGCCSGGVCRWASVDACGAAGSACVACDPRYSDECGPLGECSCGGGLPCESTQRCIGGTCQCDAGSCEGCCASSRCHSGLDDVDCGVAGLACSSCGPGDSCYFGACVGACDDLSCPAGCCSGTECHPADMAHCGDGGAPCVACDPSRSDGCSGGSCTCGTGAQCLPGQHCVGGSCRCDTTCEGCCDGDLCRARSAAHCGVDGDPCVACDPDRADNCDSTGSCRCGTHEQCGRLDSCRDGACGD